MTEVLNEPLLSFLRRAAAKGHVAVETAEEQTILNELIAKKLILGNRLTKSGWRELRKARGSLEGLFRSRRLSVDRSVKSKNARAPVRLTDHVDIISAIASIAI